MIDLPPMGPPRKRSVTIGGHATSVSLEDAFWDGLRTLARRHGLTPAQAVAEIDRGRPPEVGLATAVRLTVLAEAVVRGS
ncbi:hypothetical protein GI374_16480 [Paracoccus sp. S-4012]|uniref:ribbon-helix-helix domain-containing protein n=1 Tax=Paracoccus sp. S-4012 TaxID=2665648 RepID=UPI0012B0931B|nr:ribbon-helix-helix domain-containing protein [Paracoccus sp. S-4012]MRX51982.1 hypothetical protein [Paracoccus sp. S-4012]